MRSSLSAAALAVTCAILFAACGTTPAPTQPTPIPTPQPPANDLPVIDSITIQGTRAKEPANFADVGESVPVTAKVHDDDTPVDQLEYQWSATTGTFIGTGASVVWLAPASATTPVDVTITLKVVERYGFPGVPPAFSHDVSATASLSLHDSAGEVGGMARQFLLEFSDSNIRDVAYIMRNFEPGCYGTQDETDQVAANRKHFVNTASSVGPAKVLLNFGGICPYASKRGDACAGVPVFWDSIYLDTGERVTTAGTDWVAAFYRSAIKAWKLCDSSYDGHYVR